MSQSIARTLLEELRADEGLRRELALELASEIIRYRNARLALAQAILREVATKDDIKTLENEIDSLRKEFKNDIESLRKEFKDELRERIGVVEGRIKTLEDSVKALEIRLAKLESSHTLFTRLFIAFNIPILIGIIGTLITIIWRGVP